MAKGNAKMEPFLLCPSHARRNTGNLNMGGTVRARMEIGDDVWAETPPEEILRSRLGEQSGYVDAKGPTYGDDLDIGHRTSPPLDL